MSENSDNGHGMNAVNPVPAYVGEELAQLEDITLDEIPENCLGWTTFDSPTSKDARVSVLLPRDRLERMPTQSLVTVESQDGRTYLASCVEGPFCEPDGLKADTPIVVTATVRGRGMALFPRFHGRAILDIMGHLAKGTVQGATLRPLPNSRVFPLPPEEAVKLLRTDGDLPLGNAPVGQHDILVHARTREKIGFPRHTAVIGTTGGGKSTTVSGMAKRAQKVRVPTILLDVEGEYCAMYEETSDESMRVALEEQGLKPEGARDVTVYALAGRESKCPDPGRVVPFALVFSELSPYAVGEILEFTEAQQQRYWTAYEITKRVLKETKIYPKTPSEAAEALLIDELETGWPGMRLGQVYDVVRLIVAKLDKTPMEDAPLATFGEPHRDAIIKAIGATTLETNKHSWLAVMGRLGNLTRLRMFDHPTAHPLDLHAMIAERAISIIDLSDTESPMVRNLAIAQILRRVQLAQDARYNAEEQQGREHHPTLVIIEEAHEFLSAQRIKDMPVLFGQLARIAKRGRKRWLSLVFATQSPDHVPDEVLSLVNNWIIHRVSNTVVTRLKKTVGSIDSSLWDRAANLAPGQAIVSLTTLRRPLMTKILPTPCRLLMAD